MVVFRIHSNFFIVLPIRLKTCRSNGIFVFLQGKLCSPESVSGVQFVQVCIYVLSVLRKHTYNMTVPAQLINIQNIERRSTTSDDKMVFKNN